jgi:hypothetical protein
MKVKGNRDGERVAVMKGGKKEEERMLGVENTWNR